MFLNLSKLPQVLLPLSLFHSSLLIDSLDFLYPLLDLSHMSLLRFMILKNLESSFIIFASKFHMTLQIQLKFFEPFLDFILSGFQFIFRRVILLLIQIKLELVVINALVCQLKFMFSLVNLLI